MKQELTRRPVSLLESIFGEDLLNNASFGTGIDIYKDENSYTVELEMPGFTKEDIDVQYNGDVLSIRAEHNESEEKDEKNYFYRSRKSSSVNRQIRFSDVDDSKIDAEYQDGILKVILPKKTQEEIVNRISIK